MWDGAQDAVTWEDGRNWGQVAEADYPKTNNDKATIPAALAHAIATAGAITIGELDMQTGCTATVTLGGNLIVDDAGSEYGTLTATAGAIDANGHDIAADGRVLVDGGTLTCDAGNHTFGKDGYVAEYGLWVKSGTFVGGSGNHTISSAHFRGTSTATSGTTTLTNSRSDVALYFQGATWDDGNGTIIFSGTSDQFIGDNANTARTVYNLTVDGSGCNAQFYNAKGFNITVAGNLSIADGELDTSEATSGTSRNLTVTGTTTIGDGSGAASSAKLTCNSSTVDLNGAWTVDTDGELSLPDSSGSFNFAGAATNKGVVTPNGGTMTYDGTGSTTFSLYADTTLYNFTNASTNRRIAFVVVNNPYTLTIQNTLTSTGTSSYNAFTSDTNSDEQLTVVMGTTTSSGTITTENSTAMWLDENGGGIKIQAASADFPAIVTGVDFDWDYDAGNITLQDVDYRIAATTGGGGVTVTSTRCRFPLGMHITTGDTVKISANTASGFKKIEGDGTLQVVRGGGVYTISGVGDDRPAPPLPTVPNPANICPRYIERVNS